MWNKVIYIKQEKYIIIAELNAKTNNLQKTDCWLAVEHFAEWLIEK